MAATGAAPPQVASAGRVASGSSASGGQALGAAWPLW